MKNFIKEFIDSCIAKRHTKRINRIKSEARERIQINEFGGELWLTYDGRHVCPIDIFEKDALDVINAVRSAYEVREEQLLMG